jgi:hypothetical protein
VDDETTPYDHEWVDQHRLISALLLCIDLRIGLIRPDFDAL